MGNIFLSGQNQCHVTEVKKSYFCHTFHLRPKKVSWWVVGGWKVTLVSICVHFLKLLDTQTHRHRNGHRAWQLLIFSNSFFSVVFIRAPSVVSMVNLSITKIPWYLWFSPYLCDQESIVGQSEEISPCQAFLEYLEGVHRPRVYLESCKLMSGCWGLEAHQIESQAKYFWNPL